MYAILEQGGHQYRVSPGDRLVIDRLDAEVGEVIALEPVLVVSDGAATTLGSPQVEGARVAAVVVGHTKGRKLRVFKYKPKKRYRRTMGHRSLLTELRIEALLAKGDPLPKRPDAARKSAPAPAAAATDADVAKPRRKPAAAKAAPQAEAAVEVDDLEAVEVVEEPEAVAEAPARPARVARKPKPAAKAEASEPAAEADEHEGSN
jgi:large subunit ribosomal protein L21